MDFSSPFNTNTRLPPPEAYPAHCAHLSGSLTVEMTVDFRTPQTNTCTTFEHFATFPLCVFLLYAFLLFCMHFSFCIHSSFLLLILAVVLFILLHHAQLLWSTYNFSDNKRCFYSIQSGLHRWVHFPCLHPSKAIF